MSKTRFSLVVPTLNEEDSLPQLLASLAKQTINRAEFETIIVDGGSSDKTLERADGFKSELNLSLISSQKAHVSFQRNLGAQTAQADWVIFCDADNRLPPSFLKNLKDQISDKKPDVFLCKLDSNSYPPKQKLLVDLSNLYQQLLALISVPFYGGLIGAKKKVLRQVQFDETAARSEDLYFTLEADKLGFNVRYFNSPQYHTSMRRLEKDGEWQILINSVFKYLEDIAGVKLTSKELPYPMEGGSYYRQPVARKESSQKKLSLYEFKLIKQILNQLSQIGTEFSHQIKQAQFVEKIRQIKRRLEEQLEDL